MGWTGVARLKLFDPLGDKALTWSWWEWEGEGHGGGTAGGAAGGMGEGGLGLGGLGEGESDGGEGTGGLGSGEGGPTCAQAHDGRAASSSNACTDLYLSGSPIDLLYKHVGQAQGRR